MLNFIKILEESGYSSKYIREAEEGQEQLQAAPEGQLPPPPSDNQPQQSVDQAQSNEPTLQEINLLELAVKLFLVNPSEVDMADKQELINISKTGVAQNFNKILTKLMSIQQANDINSGSE